MGLFGCVQSHKMQPGNISIPHERIASLKINTSFTDSILQVWADKAIDNKQLSGKGSAARIILARMMLKKDLPETNAKLRQMIVWGVTGSSWGLNKKGDYDFTLTQLTAILFLFGDQPEILYPDTKNYLLKTLLTADGNKYRSTVPRSLGLVVETENHLLMTEGSRYLKNHWMVLHGNEDPYYNNIQNGMEAKVLALLAKINVGGLYEFNSLPYIGYTIAALLNLEAFASEKVRIEARNALDYMNWCYAIGSYHLKHYPPMRRRYDKQYVQQITTGYQSAYMKTWLAFAGLNDYTKDIRHAEVHALTGAVMPYRPADKVVDVIFNKGDGYFVKIGHGKKACPEIYAAGKSYLLSAGGANRGKNSMIVARPICLFLNDTAEVLSSVIHIAGPGLDYMKWNNTGVYKDFACAAGPVNIPTSYKPVASKNHWSIYTNNDSLLVAVYSTERFGLLAIFRNRNPNQLLEELVQANPDADQLKSAFNFPAGARLRYDVDAPRSKWVMISENNQLLDRDFDGWPPLSIKTALNYDPL
jgi:hypothetical protein